MRHEFNHERLDAYRLAVSVARWVATLVFPAERKHLRLQLVRAADSMVLNIAEAGGAHGGRLPPPLPHRQGQRG